MYLTLAFVLFIVALLLIQSLSWWYNRRFLREEAAKCDGPLPLPLIGNALLFLGTNYDIMKVVDNLFEKYTCKHLPVRLWLGSKLYFFTSNPDHLEIVLNAQETVGKDERYKFAENWVGTGLFTAPVQKWRRHRKVISPTFNQRILDTFTPVFVDQCHELINQLSLVADGQVFNVFPHINRCTLDIICETAMGVTVNAQKGGSETEYIKASQRSLELTMQKMFQVWTGNPVYYKLSGLASEERKCLKVIHDFSRKIVNDKIERYRQTFQVENILHLFKAKSNRKAFLDQLIEATQGTKDSWTANELQEEVDTMVIAGSDTSATMVCFILMALGLFPDIQKKVFEELRELYGATGREVEVEDLGEMKFMDLVIKETMRLFPVGVFVVRTASTDLQVTENFKVPRGAGVVLGIKSVHRDPEFWGEDVDQFRPERFLPDNALKRHPYAYLPFSGGPRNCVGQRYAMMSMKVMLAVLLRNYIISSPYSSIEEIGLKADIILRPVDGFLISLKPREDKI